MKISEYLPELPGLMQQEQRLTSLADQLSLIKADSDTYRAPSLGLDTIINTWLRNQLVYRQNMMTDLMRISKTIEEIRAPIHHITAEVFRRGISWKPKFAVKCQECQTEYNDVMKECPKCHSTDLISPDEGQKKKLESFLIDCNIFDNSLEEVLRQFNYDLNALDDAFLYLVKEYMAAEDGKIRSKVIEVRRLDPAFMEFDLDPQGLPKNKSFLCYIHRDINVATTPGACIECGRTLVPAMYKYYHRNKPMYLLDTEVIHSSKFDPSETYGWSPILTIFEKAMTIIGMDRNMYRYFFERKMPAGMIMVFTDNPESLIKERAELALKTRQDPNYIPMVAVSSKGNRGRVDFVKLFHTLQEMDYMPVRNEIRERIASMWGVTPAWQGAPDAFGGISNQTQQLTVMSRVVETDQRLFHDKVFPRIMDSFGITDWELELPIPEEKAEATRISFAQQKISAANMLLQMGFDVKAKSQEVGLIDIDFVVSGEAKKIDYSSMMGGGQGGLGGMGGEGLPGGIPGLELPEEEQPSQNQSQQYPEQGLRLMEKAHGWADQILKAGYFPMIKQVNPVGPVIWFTQNNTDYVAKFDNNILKDISKAIFPRLHAHDGRPPHDPNIPHNTVDRKLQSDSKIFEAEEPDEVDNE
ncbi:hypothetical protein HYS94_01845 [Candidatus Daviesbacteria bacterium]|nr:hypothetical protein [Candidatus Daviesbacteria bacterium]